MPSSFCNFNCCCAKSFFSCSKEARCWTNASRSASNLARFSPNSNSASRSFPSAFANSSSRLEISAFASLIASSSVATAAFRLSISAFANLIFSNSAAMASSFAAFAASSFSWMRLLTENRNYSHTTFL